MIRRSQRGWVGVDIGSQSVKLAQVERRGGRLQVSEAVVIRRREAWQDSGSPEPPLAGSQEEMQAALSLGQGFTGRQAAVALSMSLCDVRALQVAEGTESQRREQIQQELQVLGGGADFTREFDFWPLDAGEKSAAPENVLTASISRDWAQQIARDLTGARLVGQVLDSLPTALARAVELAAPGCSQVPIAAVDWGYRRATFCVVLHGRPVFVRCLRDAGFAALLAAICRALPLSQEEAQKLLSDHGVPGNSESEPEELQDLVGEVAAQPLQVFAEELDRTVTFLRQQRRALVPHAVVLFGGGAVIRNVGPFLQRKMMIPVTPWTLEGDSDSNGFQLPPLPLLGSAIALSALAWEHT